jgi:hypothetical protein
VLERFRDGVFAAGLTVGGGLAIVSVVWIIGLNYCPAGPCGYGQAENEVEQSSDQRVWQMPDAIRGTFSYEAEPEYSEGKPSLYEYYDLRAQERMAHATDWIAWLTFATGLFGAMGFFALLYTLKLQRTANDIMLRDQRPWLDVNISLSDFVWIDKNYVQFGGAYTIRNFGKTPSEYAQVRATIARWNGVFNSEAFVDSALAMKIPRTNLFLGVVFQGEKEESAPIKIGVPVVDLVEDNSEQVNYSLLLWAEYGEGSSFVTRKIYDVEFEHTNTFADGFYEPSRLRFDPSPFEHAQYM